jgi:hypothetical protein
MNVIPVESHNLKGLSRSELAVPAAPTDSMARPSKRLPRGVCLRRREAAHRDVQALLEAFEKGDIPSVD